MRELKFNNPVFEVGPNLTVRRGVRWSLEDEAMIGGVEVVKIKARVMRFSDIRRYDLRNEHDPKCRTYDGLLNTMYDLYDDFDEREIVTLVEFEVAP